MRASIVASIALLVASTCQAAADDAAQVEAAFGKLSAVEKERVIKRLQAANASARAQNPAPRRMRAMPARPLVREVRPNTSIKTVWLVRDVYSPVAMISQSWELSTEAASFSYTSDRLAKETTLAGKGAIFVATFGGVNMNLPGTTDTRIPRLTYFSFVPGFEWDVTAKNTATKNGKPTGSYAGRAGVELQFQGGPITTQYVRANAIYTTDVETSTAKIYGTELAWQPVVTSLNINTSQEVIPNSSIMFGFYPTLNLDYFHVGETANFTELVKGRDYLWLGPKVQGKLFFLPDSRFSRFSLTGEYFYLYEALNGLDQAVDYGRATANYKLIDWKSEVDPTQTASLALTVRYTKGKTPRTLEKVEEVFSGVTLSVGDIVK